MTELLRANELWKLPGRELPKEGAAEHKLHRMLSGI